MIILSDHGMNVATYDRIIYLNKYVSNTTCKIITTGPNAFIYPNPGKKTYHSIFEQYNINGIITLINRCVYLHMVFNFR